MIKCNDMPTHISGIANNAVSFSGIVINLNSSDLKRHTFLLALQLCVYHFLNFLFCAKYKCISLKYGCLNILLVSLLWLQGNVSLLIPFLV